MAQVMAVSDEDFERLWQAANKASDDPSNNYAQGAYDMIQALSGNGDISVVLDGLSEEE